jgi:RNA polymerase sigma factor (sigma-70 family)
MTGDVASALEARIAAAARGDRGAYEGLVRDHQRLVTTISLAIVGEVAASEDVAQEVFVAAWQGLPRLRNASSFLPWLRQITRNRAHKLLETRKRRREARARDDAADALIESAVDPGPHPEARWIRAEEEEVLGAALAALEDDEREILTLFYREGQSVKQVADLLGLAESAAKKRLSRARMKLRDDVLARFGTAAERTAPADSFASAVVASLPAGSMGAGGGIAWKLGGWIGKGAALLGGGVLGMLGGLAGVFVGGRQAYRGARDDEERRGLVRLIAAQAGLVVAVAILYARLSGWAAFAVGIGFLCALNFMVWIWAPRIVARRHAAERREDPERAARRQRRQLVWCVVGTILGSGAALAGFVAGLLRG